MQNIKRKIVTSLLGIGLIGGTFGCESGGGTGALIGGASGAGLGAIIGNNSHGRTAEGALIGGAVGALAGGLIGNEADKRDHYRERVYRDRRPGYYEREEYYYDRPVRRDGYYESRRYEDGDGRYYESYREYRR
jgi:hypothetical protein